MTRISKIVMLILGTAHLLAIPVFGQDDNAHQNDSILQGVVVEENEKGELIPLIGANLYWAGTTEGTTTDVDGNFELFDNRSTNKLVISYVGYDTDTVEIKEHGQLTVVLKNKTLKEFTVSARKNTTSISFMDPLLTQEMDEKELCKAACCNLSESFETNPSIDVSFTDAVTGTRQIQMLGLSGNYVMVSQENMPSARGLASVTGLSYIPGSWIKSIQITKGSGSVVNGYESLAGQINVELRKPSKERLYLNGYYNAMGRQEVNLILSNDQITKKWGSALLVHGARRPNEIDRNDDGFQDGPMLNDLIVMNRWSFNNQKGFMGQFGVKGIYEDAWGGQTGHDFSMSPTEQNTYGVEMKTRRMEAFSKTGYVFSDKRYKSIGFQNQFVYHDQDAMFGLRGYSGLERSFYSNLIYQSIIGNKNHQFKTGLSFMYDDYEETLGQLNFDRTEIVPGAFFEYTFTRGEIFNLVAGLRADDHNLYGAFVTPRLHMRYAIGEKTVLRASGGRGQRVANIFAENIGYLASSRTFSLNRDPNINTAYGLDPEVSWNMGLSLTHNFRLNYRDGSIAIDFFRTQFENQTVADVDYSPTAVVFYSSDGTSYSNSFQAQVDYELFKRFDVRMAYRWLDVKREYLTGLLTKPLQSEHRAFVNLAYETRSDWVFDYTLHWQGAKRIPYTASSPEPYILPEKSPEFYLMNAQVTKNFGKVFAAYIGMENILDFRQDNPIVSADNPYGANFDSSLVWGPIFGRTTYVGFRLILNKKDSDE